jgi:hypothetical protein
MDRYLQRPSLAPERLAEVTNLLARWLPADTSDALVSDWSEADWEAAVWVVYWQNALPWLAQRVEESGARPPDDTWQRLRAIAAESRERSRRMLNNGVELLQALERAGIAAIPLKGAVMAPLYYPDPLLRPMADLDILIRRPDLERSLAILVELGYRYYSRSAEDEVYLRGQRQANIWAADNVHPVELHYTLREEYAGMGYDLAGQMWAGSSRGPYWQESEALLPDRPTLMHHVCAHASSDWLIQRGRLLHLDDIRRLGQRMSAADWDRLVEAVPAYGARFVYPALAFAIRYSGLWAPQPALTSLRDHCPPNLLAWIEATELAQASESNPASRSALGFDLAHRLALSPGDELHFWLRSLFPRRWNLSKRYPRLMQRPWWPLAYLLLNLDRLGHLVIKLGQRISQR